MALLLESVVAGIVVALALGGKLRNLSAARFTLEPALLSLLLLHVLLPGAFRLFGTDDRSSLVVWGITGLGLVGLGLLNCRYLGMCAIGIGISLNLAVVGLNAGMPVELSAIADDSAALARAESAISESPLHVSMTDDTELPALGDVIRVPGPEWQSSFISWGDVLLYLGAGLTVGQMCLRGDADSNRHSHA